MPETSANPDLIAGWEPDVPMTDSLLRQFLVNWTASIELHGVPLGGRALRRDDLAAVDVGRPMPFANVATPLAPIFADRVAEVMTALDDFYGFSTARGTGDVHMFSPWPTPDLCPFGWTLVAHIPLMFRPAGGEAPPPPPGLRIERVTDERGLRGFEQAIVRGFPTPEVEPYGPGGAFHPDVLRDDRSRMWVGWEEDRPVCAASTFVDAGINQVSLVATVPEARRRGYGRAVTWCATLAEPALPALLLATDEGRPVYEQMGYLALFRFPLWSRHRPAQPTDQTES